MPDALAATKSFRRPSSAVPVGSVWREAISAVHQSRLAGSRFAIERRVDELRERVVRALSSLGYPSLASVDCEVASNRVILSGYLPSYHLKQMAQVVALRVTGPGRVDNRVVVTTL
jgi:hypothetical protein